MDVPTLILIGISLSMDALAVSLTAGATAKKRAKSHLISALAAGVFFGGFQALMPVLGWIAGQSGKGLVTGIDHWIAFGLLSVIGIKMVTGASKKSEKSINLLDLPTLLFLAVATSIDALAVGITFAVLNVSIWQAAAIIGLITFAACFAGVLIGNRLRNPSTSKVIEAFGGIVLIAIGTRILMEHLLGIA